MKFYFNCNNRTQARALKECGVKNVLLSYKYCKEAFDIYLSMFEGIGVIPGKIDNVDKYYDWAKLNLSVDFITQYDMPLDMEKTIKYYEKAGGIGVVPVLTENYLQHLGRLKTVDGPVVLGKMRGNIEEDEQLRKLPTNMHYHGLAKGRWVKDMNKLQNKIISVNSSTWLSGVVGRKTDVYKDTQVLLGNKGRSESATLQRILEKYKYSIEECSISQEKVLEGKYSELLKLPLALYYRPMLQALGFSSENFLPCP